VAVQGPNLKGAIAETKIAAAATELGIAVLRPIAEHGRFDLAFEIAGRLLRIQCKWAAYDPTKKVVKVKLQSQRRSAEGYVRRMYTENEIDLVAAYCGDLDRCYLLPQHLVVHRREVWLRVAPPLNSQRACINLAADFDLPGAVAQLEERGAGSAEVRGSSPLSSTSTSPAADTVGSNVFRNRFGQYLEEAAQGKSLLITRHGRPYARLGPPGAAKPETTHVETRRPAA
jgi:prevent-host-death family protein